MSDLQSPSSPVAQADAREPSLPARLSTALVSAASSSVSLETRPGYRPDTHLLQSSKNARIATKARAQRRAIIRPPKDSKVRKTVYAIIAMKAQGRKNDEIAEQLGITKNTMQVYMYRAHKRGWLTVESFDDPTDKLEIVLKSKTVRNINEFLDSRDKEVTLESAKGLGLYKQHQVVKTDQMAALGVALTVQVEMPKGADTSIARAGSLGGQPYFDAEVVE